jgi:hypothetical protein
LRFTPVALRASRWVLLAACTVGVVEIAIGIVLFWQSPLPLYDDSYITLSSAQALFRGSREPAPGLHGVTSPLHTVFVATLLAVFPPVWALWVSQLVGVLLYACGLWVLSGSETDSVQRFAIVIVGLMVGQSAIQLSNGLETGLVMAALSFVLGWSSRKARRSEWSVVVGTLPFIRPELGIVTVAVLVWSRSWRTAAIAATAAAPWVIVAGQTWLSSIHAKHAFDAYSCLPWDTKVLLGIEAIRVWSIQLGPVALGFVGLWRIPKDGKVWAAALAIAIGGYAWGNAPNLVFYHHSRYLYGWLPLVLLGFIWWVRAWPRFGLLLLTAATVVCVASVGHTWAAREAYRRRLATEQSTLRLWLAKNVRPDEPLLILDVGYLSFATRYPLVDVVGLKTPASIQANDTWTASTCGKQRGKAMSAMATLGRTKYMVVPQEWNHRQRFSDALLREGWGVVPVRDIPGSWYTVFSLSPPNNTILFREQTCKPNSAHSTA